MCNAPKKSINAMAVREIALRKLEKNSHTVHTLMWQLKCRLMNEVDMICDLR